MTDLPGSESDDDAIDAGLVTPPPEPVDFDFHDSTVWRGASVQRGSETPTRATPARRVLDGVLASPRLSTAGSALRLEPQDRQLEVATGEVYATPIPQAQTKLCRVLITYVCLRRRVYQWRTFEVIEGELARDLAARAAHVWRCNPLALFKRRSNGLCIPIHTTHKVCKAHAWWAVELPSHPHRGLLPAVHGAYHMVADANGRLRLALAPVVASTLSGAKTLPALSVAHRRYLLSLAALTAVSVRGGPVSLTPLPTNMEDLEDGDFQLLCPVAVVHPVLRPADLVLWHRHAEPQVASVVRTYESNGFALAELELLTSRRREPQVFIVDLERLW